MKKLTSTLGVFALAIGAVAAMAMSPAPTQEVKKQAMDDPHWFQIGTGAYLGQDSQTDKQNQCETGNIDCVNGYEEYDFVNNVPLSDEIRLKGNKQL